MSEKIVMRDSDEAAKPHTMQGWLSRNGRFYADEATARYDGCTHIYCRDCNAPTEKNWLICGTCRDKADQSKYDAMPKKKWDGEAMLYSFAHEKYLCDLEEAESLLEPGETLDDLRLVICEPNYAKKIDIDHFCDDLAEDEDSLPAALQDAVDAFNKASDGIVLSWSPGKFAPDLS